MQRFHCMIPLKMLWNHSARNGAIRFYDPESSSSAGTYIVTPLPSNSNYTFNIVTGTLHVNPYGPGTRAIKPVLNCVVDQGDGTYLANFEYKNDNLADFYIPVGDNNAFEVIGDGSIVFYDRYPDVTLESQPTLFSKYGGVFQVSFDSEVEIRWIITSDDKDQKSSNATSASSSSTKCNPTTKSASVAAAIEVEELDPDYLNVYPNPVTDKVHITMKDIEHYKVIMMYDMTGRQHHITSIDKRADNLEIDMAQLQAGYYIFKIVMEDSTRVVQIIKK